MYLKLMEIVDNSLTHFASKITVNKDNGTAVRQTNDSFTEYMNAIIMPMINVETDWMIILSGKPIT